MSRLAGDKLIDSENSLAIRSNWVVSAIDFVWKKRNALMARSLILPVESFRVTVYPLVYSAKAVASGAVEVFRKLSKGGKSNVVEDVASAEKVVGVSDVVSHLLPFLSSLDPPLIFEVGINMLSLADVPGGKPEWASASIIAILTLWDRQEFSSARESIVRAVVTNLHLLDLHMQVNFRMNALSNVMFFFFFFYNFLNNILIWLCIKLCIFYGLKAGPLASSYIIIVIMLIVSNSYILAGESLLNLNNGLKHATICMLISLVKA